LTPGLEYEYTSSISVWGRDFKIGEIRFSNAMTTTRNSLMPGSFGQIAYRETWSGTGGSPTPTYGGTARGGGERRWLSYNHIGNVVNTSNDAGALVESIDTDAYGNPLANVMTGAWGSSLSERGLTTKELDPAAGMYYFYQRWYDPTTATFASRAPYPPMMEHGWGYAINSPALRIDPDGRDAYRIRYPTKYGHEILCYDTHDGNGGLRCFDLNPSEHENCFSCDAHVGVNDTNISKFKDEKNDDSPWIIRTYPGSREKDERGIEWGEEQAGKDHSYNFILNNCRHFVTRGLLESGHIELPTPM